MTFVTRSLWPLFAFLSTFGLNLHLDLGRSFGIAPGRIRHARGPTKIDENCPSCSISGPSSTHPAPVESVSLPEI